MGGKQWSTPEEHYFWVVLIPLSPKRTGKDLDGPWRTWVELADMMTAAMALLGPLRRKYNETSLFEHWFQNVNGRVSPNAKKYVRRYLASLGNDVSKVKSRITSRVRARQYEQRNHQNPTRSARATPLAADVHTASGPSRNPFRSSNREAPPIYSPDPHQSMSTSLTLRPLMPTPWLDQVTNHSREADPNHNAYSHSPGLGTSASWAYRTGEYPHHQPPPYSTVAPSASYITAPTQPVESYYPTSSYMTTSSTHHPPPSNASQSRGITSSASEYLPRDYHSTNQYPSTGAPTNPRGAAAQSHTHNLYQYPTHIQDVDRGHPTRDRSHLSYSNWENQTSTFPNQSGEYASRYSLDQPPNGSTSPNMYSAASILTNLTTARQEPPPAYSAEPPAGSHYAHSSWAQQPQYAPPAYDDPPAYDSYSRTSTAPDSAHFRISAPGQNICGASTEESLFVEDNEDYSDDEEDSDQETLDTIEVASDRRARGNAQGTGKVSDNRGHGGRPITRI
ncbi:hypothetical protein GGR52DRAFT_80201 [Hypoxylon sp. FL1284]|nr:hypothetical protein GGR52DRAFT_80201 [Hypoxylon sp. FL1284]